MALPCLFIMREGNNSQSDHIIGAGNAWLEARHHLVFHERNARSAAVT